MLGFLFSLITRISLIINSFLGCCCKFICLIATYSEEKSKIESIITGVPKSPASSVDYFSLTFTGRGKPFVHHELLSHSATLSSCSQFPSTLSGHIMPKKSRGNYCFHTGLLYHCWTAIPSYSFLARQQRDPYSSLE